MAACIALEGGIAGPLPAYSTGGSVTVGSAPVRNANSYTSFAWVVGDAAKAGDQWACPSGTHLLLTVDEVNAPPSLSVAPEQVAKAYGWGLGTVLVLWAIGWSVGVLVGVIRKG